MFLIISDYPDRGLFWVRLELRSAPHTKIFVSTAHLPWAGCTTELQTGVNQRIQAAIKVYFVHNMHTN